MSAPSFPTTVAPGSSPATACDESPGRALEAPGAVDVLQNFRIIFRSARRHFHEVEERCGLSGSQLWALSVVAGAPGIRVKDLARAMAIQQSTASNLVEQLVRAGLVSRTRAKPDQRTVRLSTTGAGAAVVGQAPGPLVGMLADALSRLDPARLELLNELLLELVRTMRDADLSARHTPLADIR